MKLPQAQVQRKLIAALVLAVLFMVVEVAGGIIANRCAAAAHSCSNALHQPCFVNQCCKPGQ